MKHFLPAFTRINQDFDLSSILDARFSTISTLPQEIYASICLDNDNLIIRETVFAYHSNRVDLGQAYVNRERPMNA
jgi:hypothetical protein